MWLEFLLKNTCLKVWLIEEEEIKAEEGKAHVYTWYVMGAYTILVYTDRGTIVKYAKGTAL